MLCSRCGREVSRSDGRCPDCKPPLALNTTTGLLTRPSSSDTPADFDPPTSFEPATRFHPPTAPNSPASKPSEPVNQPTLVQGGDAATMLTGFPGHSARADAPTALSIPAATDPDFGGQFGGGVDAGPLQCGEAFGTRYHI